MSLPIFQTPHAPFSLMQTQWAASLDPIIKSPLSQGVFLKSVALKNGVTVINHLLAKQMQGWILTDVSAAATIYRSAPFNEQTLTLTSNAACTVNIYAF